MKILLTDKELKKLAVFIELSAMAHDFNHQFGTFLAGAAVMMGILLTDQKDKIKEARKSIRESDISNLDLTAIAFVLYEKYLKLKDLWSTYSHEHKDKNREFLELIIKHHKLYKAARMMKR